MKTKTEIEWVSGENPETSAIKLITIKEDGGEFVTTGSFYADEEASAPCWHFENGETVPMQTVEVLAWASLPAYYGAATSAPGTANPPSKVQELIALHRVLLYENPHCYFELAYTRHTQWMAVLATGAVDGHHDFRMLAKGQGHNPEYAAAMALEDYTKRGSSR